MVVCPALGNRERARGVCSVTLDLRASKPLVGFRLLLLPCRTLFALWPWWSLRKRVDCPVLLLLVAEECGELPSLRRSNLR